MTLNTAIAADRVYMREQLNVGIPKRTSAPQASDGRCAVLTPVGNFNNRTYQRVMTAEAPFSAVRVLVGNADPANAALISAGGVGVTGASADINPSTGVMVAVTWDGATSVTIPAAAAASRPTLRWSDWMPLSSIARTDGGTLPLLIARVDPSTSALAFSANFMGTSSGYWASGNAALAGRFDASSRGSNGLATSAAGWSVTAFFATSPIIAVEYRAAVPQVSMAVFGDSIAEGSALTAETFSQFHRAAYQVSTPSVPLVVSNHSRAGETTLTYFQRALDYLLLKDAAGQFVNSPTALAYNISSPNDGDMTASVALAAKNRAYRVMDLCAQRGVIFMPVSAIPRTNAGNTLPGYTDDTIRQALNAEFMALSGPNIISINFGGVLQSVSTPSLFASGTYTTEGIHATDAAVDVGVTGAVLPALQTLAAYAA